jgi:alkanesulfonate monooxygenase
MPEHKLTFGWYLPSHGDTTAFGNPDARVPASPQLFDEVVEAVDGAGYHYMLIPVSSVCWEAGVLGAYYVARTRHVAPLIAFRSGYVNPTLAAKTFATLDQMSGGRVCINLIAGLDDRAAKADGVFDTKEVRYEKMGEEVEIMKLLWASREPINYTGKHYRVQQAIEPQTVQKPHVPFFLGGGSPMAAETSAKHSSIHLFWGDRPNVITENVKNIRMLAKKYGREKQIQFGMRLQVICRDSEDEAWDAAKRLIEGAPRLAMHEIAGGTAVVESIKKTSEANRRVWDLLEESGDSMLIHPHLWTGIATVRVGAGIAVVGTPAQIAATLEEFIDAGCSSFCLSGYTHAEAARTFSHKVLHPYFGSRLADRLPI